MPLEVGQVRRVGRDACDGRRKTGPGWEVSVFCPFIHQRGTGRRIFIGGEQDKLGLKSSVLDTL